MGNALLVRERLTEHRARPTLDTPEHRWLARQLERIRSRSAQLRAQEASRGPGARRERVLYELNEIETRTSKLLRLEPLASAEGDPPAGFASMQLLGAPGYREAYQSCLALALGLQIGQGPVALSVKDVSTLYEYWCYLTVLRVLSEETGCAVPAGSVLSIRENGLHVDLRKGRESAASFDLGRGRSVTVAYNPRFHGDAMLVPQQPDLVMTVDEPGWPPLSLLVDAKYRVDASPEYVSRYGAPGPPEDALNVLHRYRDAILEGGRALSDRPKRTVVQAVAVYPYRERTPGAFEQTKLWRSLDRIGIGAVPLLPSQDDYLRAWLRTALGRGGWALADRTIAYRAQDRSVRYRAAASEPVLVGRLYKHNPARHFTWVREQRRYYVPLAGRPKTLRCARWVAVYSGRGQGRPGAVTHVGAVESFEVLRRGEIATPWRSSRGADELCVVYSLRELVPLPRAIPGGMTAGTNHRVGVPRWTSRLALDRATVTRELFLVAEDDWRLFEAIRASGVTFRVRPGTPARFVTPGKMHARRGTGQPGGFIVSDSAGVERRFACAEDAAFVLASNQAQTPAP